MEIVGPITPVLGVLIREYDPARNTAANVAVQVQNNTNVPLNVQSSGVLYAVAPFTATTIPTFQAPQLLIDPLVIAATESGVLFLVWLLQGEESPVVDGPLVGTTSIVTGGGGGGGPVSITGPGETVTPGDLTQAGGFTVVDAAGSGISFDTDSGVAHLELDSGGAASLYSLLTLWLGADEGGVVQNEDINMKAYNEIVLNSPTLAFHGVPGVPRAAHPVTLGDVITLLTDLGLCN